MSRPSVEIIAALANAHQGDPEQAAALAIAALEAGADAVMFRVQMAEEVLVRAHPRFDDLRQESWSAEIWRQVLSWVPRYGETVYCEVSGTEALKIALTASVHGYQVASSDLGNVPLLEALARSGGRVLLAVGGSTAREIVRAINLLTPREQASAPVLLHGSLGSPSAVEDVRLARLAWLRRLCGGRCDIGYHVNIDPDDPLPVMLALIALGVGASVLERDVATRPTRPSADSSGLDLDTFAHFVQAVRRAERAVGDSPETFAPAEREYRQQVKKRWVTLRSLSAGHVLTPQDLAMKQVVDGVAEPVEREKLVGRPLLKDCPEEYPLRRADVPQTVWAVVFARMRSSRLPGKALADVGDMPALLHLFERLKQAQSVGRIVLCTTRDPLDDSLVQLAAQAGVHWFRGPTDDVLARVLGALDGQAVDVILRVTGDDILVDPDYVDRAVRHHLEVNAEYSDLKALPSGTEVEVIDVALLRDLSLAATDSGGSEYLTTYIVDHRDQIRASKVPVDDRHAQPWRLTLDTAEDYQVIRAVLDGMRARGKALTYRLDDIVDFFTGHPEILMLNAHVRQRQTPPEVCTDLDWSRLT